jgi:hypothetical protein
MSDLKRNNHSEELSQSNEFMSNHEIASGINKQTRQVTVQAMEETRLSRRLFPDERKRAAVKGEL